MATHIKVIIDSFQEWWKPQTISVAENVFTRFMAGETIDEVKADYDLNTMEIESALRFFALYWKRNRSAVELYENWQKRRFAS